MQSEGLPGDTSPGGTGANPTDFQGGYRILPTFGLLHKLPRVQDSLPSLTCCLVVRCAGNGTLRQQTNPPGWGHTHGQI